MSAAAKNYLKSRGKYPDRDYFIDVLNSCITKDQVWNWWDWLFRAKHLDWALTYSFWDKLRDEKLDKINETKS